ncbi:hypothetical protein CEXT_112481 [Caerostris extrusa]|uniref:Uncharacterized protein n=1 Tax=Caerostris extrusa TaxID=172846 RepID=A0AAV4W543_CAEEX|nr:hypothetical protein CEXT_112481 [Caerostris extrusa]
MLMKTDSQNATKDEGNFPLQLFKALQKHEAAEIQLPCRNYSNEATESQDNCQGGKARQVFLTFPTRNKSRTRMRC